MAVTTGVKTSAFEQAFLKLIFNNTDIPNVGDATGIQGSTTAGDMNIGLLTAYDETNEDMSGSTECAYTGYARVGVARTAGTVGSVEGWEVYDAGSGTWRVKNTLVIEFGERTDAGATETALYVLFSKDTSNFTDAYQIFVGSLNSSLAISQNIQPRFAQENLILEEK